MVAPVSERFQFVPSEKARIAEPAAPFEIKAIVPVPAVAAEGADATVYLAKTVAVPADTSIVVIDTPIYLMEGDILKGGASAASDLDLFVSFEILDDA